MGNDELKGSISKSIAPNVISQNELFDPKVLLIFLDDKITIKVGTSKITRTTRTTKTNINLDNSNNPYLAHNVANNRAAVAEFLLC